MQRNGLSVVDYLCVAEGRSAGSGVHWHEGVDDKHKGTIGLDARDRCLERPSSTVGD